MKKHLHTNQSHSMSFLKSFFTTFIFGIVFSLTAIGTNTITLSSAVGTNAQTKCINTAITDITYTTTEATGATFSNLPSGVNGSWSSNTVTITGTPSQAGTFSYTVTLTGGTGTVTANGTITVNPTLSAVALTPTSAQAICSNGNGSLLTATETGGGTITSRQWGKRSATGGTITNISGATGQTYTPTGTDLTAGTWYIVCTSTPTCGSASISNEVTVVVTALPTASISYSGSPWCTSAGTQTVTLNGTNAYTGGTYSSTTGLTINTSTGAITPSTSTAGNYTVTYTIAAAGGCSAVTATANVTVTALPTASISYSGSPWCTSATAQSVSLTGTTGGTYTASPSGLSLVAGTGAITPSSSTANAYTVTYTIAAAGGCSAVTANASVTVNALPTVTITGSSPICVGGTSALSPTIGGTWASSSASLATVTSAGVVTGVAAGSPTFTFTQTSTGCTNTTSAITVNALPTPTLTSNDTDNKICAGTSVTFSASGGTSYEFFVGSTSQGATSATATFTTTSLTNGQTVTAKVTNANGCIATSSGITTSVNPLPTISTNGTIAPVCYSTSATTTSLAYTTTTNTPTSYSIDWNPAANSAGLSDQGITATTFNTGSGTITTIAIPANLAANTYSGTMTITNANGCTATQNLTVTVNPLPTITTTGTSAPVCYSATATTTSLAYTATTNTPTSYSIDWNPAANSAGLSDQGITATTFNTGSGTITTIAIPANLAANTYSGTMTITNANGCTATQNLTVTVNPLPTLTGATQAATVCDGSTATINLTGLLASSTFTINYSIAGVAQTAISNIASNSSGTASFTTPTLTYTNNGQTLQVTSITCTSQTTGCSKNFAQNVTLSVSPTSVGGSIAGSATVCTGANSTALTLSGKTGSVTKWQSSTTSDFSSAVTNISNTTNSLNRCKSYNYDLLSGSSYQWGLSCCKFYQ